MTLRSPPDFKGSEVGGRSGQRLYEGRYKLVVDPNDPRHDETLARFFVGTES